MKSFNIVVLCLVALTFVSSTQHFKHHRVKRRVVFTKSSKFFFRLNGKDNVINQTEIFAHGWSIRVNYDLPSTIPKRKKFFKREANEIETIGSDSQMGDVYNCALKYLCEMVINIQASGQCGMFCEINKIISGSKCSESEYFQTIFSQCDQFLSRCPYSYLESGKVL